MQFKGQGIMFTSVRCCRREAADVWVGRPVIRFEFYALSTAKRTGNACKLVHPVFLRTNMSKTNLKDNY